MSTSLRDRIQWFSQVEALRTPMVSVVDVVQDLPGHWQVLTTGLTFYILCKGAGVEPIEVLRLMERFEKDVDAPFANQFQAMLAYAKGELNA